MRLPAAAHTDRPWRIHEVTPDFRLEDVWALPGVGGPSDFPVLIEQITSTDPASSSSRVVRTLFAVRWKLGELLGWDDAGDGLGGRVETLRQRLPGDLHDAARPPFPNLPFETLYLTEDEFAAETANRTMHGVLHIGRIPDGDGGFRAQLAVLVKPNGVCGEAYMAAIKPFRHLFVYPALLRAGEQMWRARSARTAAGSQVR